MIEYIKCPEAKWKNVTIKDFQVLCNEDQHLYLPNEISLGHPVERRASKNVKTPAEKFKLFADAPRLLSYVIKLYYVSRCHHRDRIL